MLRTSEIRSRLHQIARHIPAPPLRPKRLVAALCAGSLLAATITTAALGTNALGQQDESENATAKTGQDTRPIETSGNPARATSQVEKGGTVVGRLVKDGKPLRDISVAMSQIDKSSPQWTGKEYVTKTDESGRFEFTNLPRDEMYVYGMMRDLAKIGSSPVRMCQVGEMGSKVSVGDLQVQAAHTVTGRVVLSDHKAIPQKTRIVFARISTRSWLSPLDAQVVDVAPDGSFEVDGIPTGLIDVTTRVKGYRLSDENPSLDRLNGFSINGLVNKNVSELAILLEPGKRRAVNPRTLEKDEARKFSEEELAKKRRPIRGVNRVFSTR